MIKLALADDHKLFAQGVANLLKADPELSVEAVFDNGKSMVLYLADHSIDVVLVDLNMPHQDGLETMRQIRAMGYDCKIIVLSMYAEESIFKKCIEAGIDGYILKDAEPEELIYTIKEVFEGHHQLNFQHILQQAEPLTDFPDDFVKKFKLSKRELEIIKLIKDGFTSQEMADQLFLSAFTIQTHRKNIIQKLQVSNTAELIQLSHQYGL